VGVEEIRNPELKRNPRARPKEVWVKAREDALQPIVLHESRHSAASYAREAGLDDVELAAFVGHSDSRTTKSIYVHLFDDSTEKVTAKLNAYHKKAG
jgi:integrase